MWNSLVGVMPQLVFGCVAARTGASRDHSEECRKRIEMKMCVDEELEVRAAKADGTRDAHQDETNTGRLRSMKLETLAQMLGLARLQHRREELHFLHGVTLHESVAEVILVLLSFSERGTTRDARDGAMPSQRRMERNVVEHDSK